MAYFSDLNRLRENVQLVGQDQWPILVTSIGWEKMFNRLGNNRGLTSLPQFVGENSSTGWSIET